MKTTTNGKSQHHGKQMTTHNRSFDKGRGAVIDLLNVRLADTLDLYSQLKQAHWNVNGENFIGLHELFDRVAHALEEHVDLIAERAVQLGGTAYGTVRLAAKNSTVPEYPINAKAKKEHVEAVSQRLAAYSKQLHDDIESCDEKDDPASADMLTDILRDIDKWLWFVEAHGR